MNKLFIIFVFISLQHFSQFFKNAKISNWEKNVRNIKITLDTLVLNQKVLDKIFQPFFTTKPTGLGTGLGLSLSYDIVKAHGGELKVETIEGEGSIFIIQLPII